MIRDNQFSFAGRILANRGLSKFGQKVTLSNCYVVEKPKDNLEGIYRANYEIARIFSYSGGAGVDLSLLRPNGSKVNNAAKTTTGPVSFMPVFNQTGLTIGQNGRRAALMVSLTCEHPDIEEFIFAKKDSESLKMMNTSVRFTDRFMKAAVANEDFMLNFHVESTRETITKMVDAGDLLNKFSANNHSQAEPGALFWDRIEGWSLLSDDPDFEFEGVNPCAEEPLPKNGSCCLAAINLSEFVINPFQDNAKFDMDKFRLAVPNGVRGLNDILDEGMPLHPLEQIKDAVRDYRQIGLGIMGYADMLIKLGVKYGSKESLNLINQIGHEMINLALQESALIAKDKGAFPKYYEQAIFASKFFRTHANEKTRELVKKYGLRNSQLLTIAPTGSTAPLLGASWAAEPIYDVSYKVKTDSLMGGEAHHTVFTPIVEELMKVKGITSQKDLPDYIVTAKNLGWKDRIDTQGAFQHYIDASISSTVNLPNEATVEVVNDIYVYAWKSGLKGITVYRDGCDRTGVLESIKLCPNCETELAITEGCESCPSCGYGACSI